MRWWSVCAVALALWLSQAGCGYLADLEGARYEAREGEADAWGGGDLGGGDGDAEADVISQAPDVDDDFSVGSACEGYQSRSGALESLCGEMGCGDPQDPFCGEACEGDCVCEEGARCAGACRPGEECASTCAAGSVCAFEGHNLGSMALTCESEATCRTECASLGRCETRCEAGATCEVSCAHASQCRLTCERGSECWMRCAQTGDCRLDCEQGASCRLVLEGAAGALECGSRVKDCGGGESVCRGECGQ
jgi:hypothetical protein